MPKLKTRNTLRPSAFPASGREDPEMPGHGSTDGPLAVHSLRSGSHCVPRKDIAIILRCNAFNSKPEDPIASLRGVAASSTATEQMIAPCRQSRCGVAYICCQSMLV